MRWPATGYDQDRIHAHVIARLAEALEQDARGVMDPAEAKAFKGKAGLMLAPASLHFDKGDDLAAARDQINLAAPDPSALRNDRPAMKPQPPRRNPFGATTHTLGASPSGGGTVSSGLPAKVQGSTPCFSPATFSYHSCRSLPILNSSALAAGEACAMSPM